jgi:hypothetical protein
VKTVTIKIFRDTQSDVIVVSDDGGEYDDAEFYDDGGQSSASVEREAEHELEGRIHHYEQDNAIQVVRS